MIHVNLERPNQKHIQELSSTVVCDEADFLQNSHWWVLQNRVVKATNSLTEL